MRLLVDAHLTPVVVSQLRRVGHDAVHVTQRGLGRATDLDILRAAVDQRRVLISSDTDFGALLAAHRLRAPSLVLMRQCNELSPDGQAALLTAALEPVEDDVEAGAVVVIRPGRVRVRRLPFGPT